ncbi:MAG: Hint domain-containing protein, partial [Paracoccaceae bacterium]
VAGVALAHEPKQVTYLHLLCDRHEVIFANGCPSETLLPGQEAMRKVGPEARAELRAILPELATSSESPCSARQLLEGSKRKSVVRRHLKHQRPFVTHAA